MYNETIMFCCERGEGEKGKRLTSYGLEAGYSVNIKPDRGDIPDVLLLIFVHAQVMPFQPQGGGGHLLGLVEVVASNRGDELELPVRKGCLDAGHLDRNLDRENRVDDLAVNHERGESGRWKEGGGNRIKCVTLGRGEKGKGGGGMQGWLTRAGHLNGSLHLK